MNPLDSILVIGTSKKMINKIVERLELPLSIEWISIEKFQSPKELAIATERRSKNFHVIPIYPADITRTYFGSWFKKVIIRLGKKQEEVVVVKPVYTGKDLVIISPQCVKDIVLIMADRDINIHKIKIEYEIVKLVVSTKKHVSINELLRWRDDLIQNIHHLLNINYTIDIEWKSIQSQNRLFS
ncbi:hypothetical protein JCM9140_3536 [Halalkalibacter wakoensis JCM 9140]|uniref:Uncharacterized protein n=1 Tax=Halalkalibacter wakoensis JCM 9140 TaxID=1236970 RepID=W4Q5X7_9BACI|nr:hypothetical protein [Halalkalibacter wakoensis]GAE27392.1 hypothetical protein JCM9140_3536 [Halalkalibacter wakoensis JCM 9140]